MGAQHLLTETGAANGFDSMAYLNLGTGLAAGIVQHGVLLRGGHGHRRRDRAHPDRPERGRVQLRSARLRRDRRLGLRDRADVADGRCPPRSRAVPGCGIRRPRCLAVQERFFEGVSAAVRILVLSTDVDAVVIGGGLSALGAPLIDGVRAALDRAAASSRFLASLDLAERVHIIPLGFPAAAVGAALTGVTHG